jgi:hypothetical protein
LYQEIIRRIHHLSRSHQKLYRFWKDSAQEALNKNLKSIYKRATIEVAENPRLSRFKIKSI